MSSAASSGRESVGIPCQLVSWDQFALLSRQLARTIHTSWFRPDLIVAIGRGGYLPARILSDYLNVFDLASMKIEHYHGLRRQKLARVRYPLGAEVGGRHVLLVDDVTVGRIGEGEIFGAMAALTHADRSATVRAKTACSVVKVPREQFTELIKSNPATIHSLLVDMANSIVNLNEQLVGLQGSHVLH